MVNSPTTCDCSDYSQLTAVTGLQSISTASASLAAPASGATPIVTAGAKGMIVKSITIKATQPTTNGMVRIFVSDGLGNFSLYKEVPVPVNPVFAATPTPPLVLPMFEMKLEGGLKLAPGFQIFAATQNAESFNVIVEGLDWNYPVYTAPEVPPCCSLINNTANTGIGTVNVANSSLKGGGAIVDLLTASPTAKGTTINNVVIKATQSTHPGMVRLFITPDGGTTYFLYKEILIPETTQSSNMPAFKQIVNCDFCMQHSGGNPFMLSASTEVGEGFALTVEGTDWNYA